MNYGQPAQTQKDNFESISVGNGANDPNFNGNAPAENFDTSNWDINPSHDSQAIGGKVKTLSETALPMPGDHQNIPEPMLESPYSVDLFERGKVMDYDRSPSRNQRLGQNKGQHDDIEPIKTSLELSKEPIRIAKNLNDSGINEVEKVKQEIDSSPRPDYGSVYDEIRGIEGMVDEAMKSFGPDSVWQSGDGQAKPNQFETVKAKPSQSNFREAAW